MTLKDYGNEVVGAWMGFVASVDEAARTMMEFGEALEDLERAEARCRVYEWEGAWLLW